MRLLKLNLSLRAAVLLGFIVLRAVHAQTQEGPTHADWPSYGGSTYAWRYSALDQINVTNVKKLAPAWIFSTGDYVQGLQSTPIVLDGVMYLSTSRSQVFALDAASGRVIWQYKYPLPRGPGVNAQNRGVAVGDGKVFIGTYDDYLVAIDQRTGREMWKVATDDASQCGCTITAAPLITRNTVIVGSSGGDRAFRGYLTAFNIKTGRLAWRFYTIPGEGEPGHETWKGDSWKFGGGAPWTTGSYDPQLNLLYWGVGNAAADMYAGDRDPGGPAENVNLYTASIVALDSDTGKLKWFYQEVPKDVWDFDAAYECVLVDREVKGRMRKLLLQVSKAGYTFVLDRETGEFLNAFPIVDTSTWVKGITEDGKLVGRNEPVPGKVVNVCPSAMGAKQWNQVAYSPRTGLLYTPTIEMCANYTAVEQEPVEGAAFGGGRWDFTPAKTAPNLAHIDGYDAGTGKRAWSVPQRNIILASMLATAGDLLFTGDPLGNYFALNAGTGEKLWSFQTGAGHRGSSITYAVNGRQYIATPTGIGGAVANTLTSMLEDGPGFRGGSTLVVFALPEDQK